METKKIHIGNWIQQVLIEKNVKPSELARRIQTTRQNIGSILKKDSIDVKQLFTICNALNYDFFQAFILESEKCEQKSKVILQIEIEENKINEVLKFIENKQLYNMLKI